MYILEIRCETDLYRHARLGGVTGGGGGVGGCERPEVKMRDLVQGK